MPRTHRKRRENKRLYATISAAEAEVKRQQLLAEENLCVSGLYGRHQSDPVAKIAISNIERYQQITAF